MSATAEFRFHATFTRLPPGRAYMAAWTVYDEQGDGVYWPGGQTPPAKQGGTLQHFISIDELSGNGVYPVYSASVYLRELTQPPDAGAALDLDGNPLVYGPVELPREETSV